MSTVRRTQALLVFHFNVETGIMAARGILANPALFAGYPTTPLQCVSEWINISLSFGIKAHVIHQHLMFMLFRPHSKIEKAEFNSLSSVPSIIEYFEKRGIEIGNVNLAEKPKNIGPLLMTKELLT